MTSESLIHVKLEFEEALQSKKDVLSSELDLLRLAKTIQKYHFLRLKELRLKINLYQKIKELKSNIRKLEQILPKIKIPKILEDKIGKEKLVGAGGREIGGLKEKGYDKSLEAQLQEIQDKLNSLQER